MLTAENITKAFSQDGIAAQALKGVSLTVEPGEFVSIVGRSGSGKSTLLSVLSTLLKPDAGRLLYNGRDLAAASEAEINALRHRDFAVIFQFHYLLPYLTALENVLLPFMRGLRPVLGGQKKRALECVERVGLADKAGRLPGQLSGGEQQRVAIARAISKIPEVLLCDEPPGALDSKTGIVVLEALERINRELGTATAIITHNVDIAGMADRVIHLSNGRITEVAVNAVKKSASELQW